MEGMFPKEFFEKVKFEKNFAAYIQVHFRLDFFMAANNMNTDQTAPKSSLICVHIVCNIGYLRT